METYVELDFWKNDSEGHSIDDDDDPEDCVSILRLIDYRANVN